MTISMKLKAFTLIELLITAVLLVIVAGYSVVILSSTVNLSAQAQRSTGASSQSRQAIDTVSRAFAQSSTTTPVAVLSRSEANTPGSVIIFTVLISNNIGAPSATTEQRIYCTVGTTNGKFRLAQFVETGTYNGGTSSLSCNNASLSTAFTGGSISGPTYITDTTTNVTLFLATREQYNTTVPAPDPSALHFVLTSSYDVAVANVTATERSDASVSSHSITVEATASRNRTYNLLPVLPFSGL
jgi:prepilin-type N-terminal cleavage/methylation domain-containing protein